MFDEQVDEYCGLSWVEDIRKVIERADKEATERIQRALHEDILSL